MVRCRLPLPNGGIQFEGLVHHAGEPFGDSEELPGETSAKDAQVSDAPPPATDRSQHAAMDDPQREFFAWWDEVRTKMDGYLARMGEQIAEAEARMKEVEADAAALSITVANYSKSYSDAHPTPSANGKSEGADAKLLAFVGQLMARIAKRDFPYGVHSALMADISNVLLADVEAGR